MKATISRKNIASENREPVWQNTIRSNRKIVGKIFEPCAINNYRYKVEVSLGGGYGLHGETDSMPDAMLMFDDFTDGKYSFN